MSKQSYWEQYRRGMIEEIAEAELPMHRTVALLAEAMNEARNATALYRSELMSVWDDILWEVLDDGDKP
jgi:hypothetical protein